MESESPTADHLRCLRRDDHFREIFARDRESSELSDPYVTLLDVFRGISDDLWLSVPESAEEGGIPKLLSHWQPPSTGSRCVVANQMEFVTAFNAFTSNIFSGMDWSNVFVAGGAVLANCLRQDTLPTDGGYSSSDIDMFLYGLPVEGANEKLRHIHSVITNNSSGCEVIRTRRTVTFLNSYPYRHVQVILRLYKSPAEVLLGFDIDCCTFGYDGRTIWTAERGRRSVTKRYNLVNSTRRSSSYESRLVKYARRGFAVAVPGLKSDRVDWGSLVSKQPWEARGLAKLLLYDIRYNTLSPEVDKGKDVESDYDPEITIPWGPGWSAAAVLERLNTQDKAHIFSSAIHARGAIDHTHLFRTGIDDVIRGGAFWCKECHMRGSLSAGEGRPISGSGFVPATVDWSTDCPAYQDIDNAYTRLMTGSFHPVLEGGWDDGVYVSEGTMPAVTYDQAVKEVAKRALSMGAARSRPSSLSVFALPDSAPSRTFFASSTTAKPTKTSVRAPVQLKTLSPFAATLGLGGAGRFRLQPQRVTNGASTPTPLVSEGAFSCGVCGQSFYSQNQLRRHVRTTGHVVSATLEPHHRPPEPPARASGPDPVVASLGTLSSADTLTKTLILFAICCRQGLITSSEKTRLKAIYLDDPSVIDASIDVYALDGSIAELCDTWRRVLMASEGGVRRGL